MSRQGVPGNRVRLTVHFRRNGSLFDPFYLGDVKIYDAEVGGTLLSTITPLKDSTGIYFVDYDIPSDLASGQYWDQWEWIAEDGATTDVRRVSFTVAAQSSVSVELETSLELRLQVIEKALNELQTAVLNLATKRELNYLAALYQRNFSRINDELEILTGRVEVLEV